MKYKIPPWKHQLDIIDKAVPLPSYALFAEMGTGKTATTINILRHKYYHTRRLMRTMVFCPPVVRTNWKREFEAHSKCGPDVTVLEGAGKKRLRQFESEAFGDCFGPLYDQLKPRIFVTNYESLLMKDLYKLFLYWKPEVLVFDESHYCKSNKSKRTKLAIKLADLATHKYCLTGTPILNNAMDIWAQFRILDGGETFDTNFYAFRAQYFIDKNANMPSHKRFPDWRPRPGIEDVFNQKIYAKASRVLKKDCLDLPPVVRKTVQCDMGTDQAKAYKEMLKNFITYINGEACVASIALTKALRLQQIATGFYVTDESDTRHFKTTPRIDLLVATLADIYEENSKAQVIVWACFKDNYKQIVKALEDKYSLTHLLGGMTDNARQKSIDSFQAGESQIMIANQQAGGVGVNLTNASYAVYFSRNFSLEADLQSEARCHRGGSEKHDKITRIDIVATDTIDEVVAGALARKENLANNILTLRDKL